MRRLSSLGLGSALLVLVLGACGSRAELKPEAGESPPVIAAGAKRAATTEELLTPDAQAQPQRSDELLKRSESREPDDFDLPPPG